MFRKLAKSMLRPINHSAVVLLGIYTVLWGVWLLSPFWDVFTVADLYSKMSELAPEWVWGLNAMISGIPIIYGSVKPSYKTMIVGSLVGTLHWGLLAFMYFWGDWNNTGGITSLFISFYAAFIYVNVRVNKVEFEHPNPPLDSQ